MILVHGTHERFIEDVVHHLSECGHAASGVAPDAHLFSEVVARKARAVIGIVGQRAAEAECQEAVDVLVSASCAPTSPRIVLVTPGPLDAPHIHSLKKSGAPYVVVSSAGVRGLAPMSYLPRARVWLSRQLLEPEHALVTEAALLATLSTAVREDTGTGIELTPTSCSWRDALEHAAVRVVTVPNWMARLAYAIGAPALYVASDRVRARLGSEAVAAALGVLPAEASAAA